MLSRRENVISEIMKFGVLYDINLGLGVKGLQLADINADGIPELVVDVPGHTTTFNNDIVRSRIRFSVRKSAYFRDRSQKEQLEPKAH